jgi:two-component sensor histidine kinase/PAS domain-containing protein
VAGLAKTPSAANDFTVFIRPLDDTTVEGSAVIQDIQGKDTIQIVVMMPRDIYQQGKTTLFSFLIILASIALIIGIMVISLIDTLVLQRLSFLYTEVDAIGKTGDISSRVWIDGDDEIAHLATGMNASLEKLEITQMNLRKSESELNTIINSSPIPQFVIDKTHTIIHWNKALENLTGIKADTIIGTNRQWTAFYKTQRPCIADLVVDGKAEKIPEVYAGKYTRSELLGGQYEVTDFFPGLGESGKWLYFTSTGIHDSGGAVTGAIETLVDITEQKKSQEEMSRTNEQLTAALQELRSTEEVLIGNISELEKAKQKLQKSEAKFRDIATNIPGIVFQFTVHGPSDITIPFISDRISMFTLGPDEIYSNPNALFNLVHRDDADFVRTSLLESARTKVPWNVEFRMKANGVESPRWFNGRGIPHELEEDTIWVGVLIDITERKLLQEEIGAALKEKELLLKEIHHRVKNNIQVIASLLNMQSRTVEDRATKEVLREAQNRVKSIALVHEKLYQSKSLDRIDYHDYIQKISLHLSESYGISQKNITMNIRAENISLHIDKAIPCSLIINELLSNAFKHAFPHGTKGDIWIELRKNGNTMELTYRDNGIGLPEGISPEHAETLGMRLLYGLTNQLHGTINVKGFKGTHITITFPSDTAKDVTP